MDNTQKLSYTRRSLNRFIQHEAAGGILLVIAAIIAMLVANSPLQDNYQNFLNIPIHIQIGELTVFKPLLLWVNDGLMVLFFLLIGIELKREFLEGELSKLSQIALPLIGALGGIILPAIIYIAITYNNPIALHGWAIPTATDIAFALGVLTLLGPRIPTALKIFLMTVAMFDDLAAIIIIAIFYSKKLSLTILLLGLIPLSILAILNRKNISETWIFVVVGIILWMLFLKSGVHATLGGVILAMFIPHKSTDINGQEVFPLKNFERGLVKWVNFLVLPTFAFVNSGLSFANLSLHSFVEPITLGIIVGLFVGKQIGIFSACFLSHKLGIVAKDNKISWRQLYGAAILCGIGFTMSLYIGSLAFDYTGSQFINLSQLGIFSASVLSAVIGALVLVL